VSKDQSNHNDRSLNRNVIRGTDGSCICSKYGYTLFEPSGAAINEWSCISPEAVTMTSKSGDCPTCALTQSNLEGNIKVTCTREASLVQLRMDADNYGPWRGEGQVTDVSFDKPKFESLRGMKCRKQATTNFENVTVFREEATMAAVLSEETNFMGGGAWSVSVPIQCKMDKNLTCETAASRHPVHSTEIMASSLMASVWSGEIQPLKCTRTSTITSVAAEQMHVENGIPGQCPTDSWTAIVKASGERSGSASTDQRYPVAANIYELIQKKGADYCQRFAVQF
jgi:hypothetical protein